MLLRQRLKVFAQLRQRVNACTETFPSIGAEKVGHHLSTHDKDGTKEVIQREGARRGNKLRIEYRRPKLKYITNDPSRFL